MWINFWNIWGITVYDLLYKMCYISFRFVIVDVYRSIGPLSHDVQRTRACSWSIVDLVTMEEELDEVEGADEEEEKGGGEENNFVAFIGEVMNN